MTERRGDIVERRDQALRDLTELEEQLRAEEVDEATAERLRARYELEVARAVEALTALDDRPAGDPPSGGRGAGGSATRLRRWVAVVVVLVAVVAAGGLLLSRSLSPRPAGGFVTGNEVAAGTDLSTVSDQELEQVVADNPEVVGMRLALAHRYFEAGELGRALDHYREVLDREPHAEALANVGWILYVSTDEVDAAAGFVEESLARDPGSVLAMWFLANIRLDGLDDPSGAVEVARELLARDDLRPQDRAAVEGLLERAETRLPGGSP